MSNKHKHYDMIVAKAADMELVRLVKLDGSWIIASSIVQDSTQFDARKDYFLCLPQHKEAVLLSLNGDIAQFESPREDGEHALERAEWSKDEWYMQPDATSRIKPRKEKRWVVINPKSGNVNDKLFIPTSRTRQDFTKVANLKK